VRALSNEERGSRVLDAAVREVTKAEQTGNSLARVVRLIERALGRRHVFWWIVAVGLALHAVSLGLGLTADDHFHAVALRDDLVSPGMERAAWDQFAFAKGRDANQRMIEEGAFPWWTDPALVIAFFRPLSSLTLWIDHHVWPHTPWLMHLHSLAWFVGLLGAVWCVLRTLAVPPALAALALLVYAVDDARSMPVGWLANRNALVALVPGFFALAAHVRWRTSGALAWAWVAIVCMALALLGGEPALPVCGYLFAYALFVDSGSFTARSFSLVPYALLVIAWRALYNQLGYGALHSGVYLDPGREPFAFGVALLERLPILLLSQFALPMSDLWEAYPLLHPALQPLMLAAACVVLGTLGWLLWPLVRRDAVLRFWLAGAVLATIPVCGTHPEDRVLTATSLGGAAVIAHGLLALSHQRIGLRSPALQRAAGWTLLLVHLVVAPLLLPLRTLAIVSMEVLMVSSDASIPHGPASQDQTVILLNPPIDLFAVYLPAFRLSRGVQPPGQLRWLATGESALRVERLDDRTLSLSPADGFLSTSSQQMFRRTARRFTLGEQVRLHGLTIQVTRLLSDGRPATVMARFDRDLDDSRLRWLRWEHRGYVRFVPPAIGAAVELPAVDLTKVFLD
jgi:hypothetical protein